MKIPAIFINHGGGPLPLMGRQPEIVQHLQHVRTVLDQSNNNNKQHQQPKAIVCISAHWESSTDDAIEISSIYNPSMIYDYNGFPKETYDYKYTAPGLPKLANHIQELLISNNINCTLNTQRGYDHGIFVPLMILYPEATIPIVCISLHSSLDATKHIQIGQALQSLVVQSNNNDDIDNNDDTNEFHGNVLLIGSGYTFHNMNSFFNPTPTTYKYSNLFNNWLKDTILHTQSYEQRMEKLINWKQNTHPYGQQCHPREEHLLPLFVVAAAAAGPTMKPILSYNVDATSADGTSSNQQQQQQQQQQHAISSYYFENS